MNVRGTLAITVGLVQSVIAALAFIFACCLYFNFFGAQTWLDGAMQPYGFHTLILLVFGFFSIVSGLFLVYEWLESR